MGAAGARSIALTLVAVDAVGLLGLLLLSMLGDPFGVLNDAGNAAVGALSALLAWSILTGQPPGRPPPLAGLGASVIGGGIMIVGSLLVVTNASGWYFAALVSSVGAGFIGGWLVVVNRPAGFGALSASALRLGRFTGIVMLTGVLAVPGLPNRINDWELPPWYLSCSQVSWVGTYLLYPIWCVLLARSLGRAEP